MKKTLLALALLAPITSHARATIYYKETWELFYMIPLAFLMMACANLIFNIVINAILHPTKTVNFVKDVTSNVTQRQEPERYTPGTTSFDLVFNKAYALCGEQYEDRISIIEQVDPEFKAVLRLALIQGGNTLTIREIVEWISYMIIDISEGINDTIEEEGNEMYVDMTMDELKLARMQSHPDKGGDREEFIRYDTAYKARKAAHA